MLINNSHFVHHYHPRKHETNTKTSRHETLPSSSSIVIFDFRDRWKRYLDNVSV